MKPNMVQILTTEKLWVLPWSLVSKVLTFCSRSSELYALLNKIARK